MKLKKLRIEGFRAIRELVLEDLTELTILVGPNGVGKSSIFQAIGLLKDHIGSYTNSRSDPGQSVVNAAHSKAVISSVFELSSHEQAFVAKELGTETVDKDVTATLEIANGRTSPSDCPILKTLFEKYLTGSQIGVIEHFSPYRRLTADGISSIDIRFAEERPRGSEVYDGRSDYVEIFRNLSQLLLKDLIEFQATGQSQDSMKPFTELFGRLLDPKRLLPPCVDESGIHLEVGIDGGKHRLRHLSAGELETLAVFATIQRLRTSQSIILYDSPEVHLNGTLERRVLKEIERVARDNQMIVATHSYEIIENAAIDSIVRIEPYSRRNQAVRLNVHQERIRVFEALGASVGVQLISKTVAFVEGASTRSDPRVIKLLLPDLPDSVSLIPSASVTNVLEAAGRTTELLKHASKHSRFICITDRDYRSEDERRMLMRKYTPNLVILERYHLENYLLDGEAIAAEMSRLGIGKWKPSDIWNELESAALQLRPKAIIDYVRYQLNGEMHKIKLQSADGPDPVNACRANILRANGRLAEVLAEDKFEMLVQERTKWLDENWPSKVWLTVLPGRDILENFRKKHCSTPSAQFLSLLIHANAERESDGVKSLRTELACLWSAGE